MKKQETAYFRIANLFWSSFLIALAFSFAANSAAQEKPAAAVNRDSVIAAAREIMDSQQYCALITVDSTGRPQVRTMNPFPPEQDMSVWMATNSRTRKVQEIRRDPRVCLYYADHGKATG
ncbi:MAG TPA: pyridoxamine 5'-phosphate oxidase family protein, partial [bacterium]